MANVKRLLQSDITKIFIFFILTAICAATLAPGFYNVGKFIAEISESHHLNSFVNWLAQSCAKAEFPTYFNVSFILCTLILAGPFVMWMQLGESDPQPKLNPWRIKLPTRSIAHTSGQALKRNPRGWLHVTTGFLLAGSLLTLMTWLLLTIGWFKLSHPVDWPDVTLRALTAAVIYATLQEWVFRGILLGVLLRAMKPGVAICTLSFFYATIHFLTPPEGIQLTHPSQADAGFRMLAICAQRFLYPQSLFLGFVTLLIAGLILAYARYRTSSLWLPIGLNAGWLFVIHISQQITSLNGDHLQGVKILIDPGHLSGILPICILLSTGLLVHAFVQTMNENNDQPE